MREIIFRTCVAGFFFANASLLPSVATAQTLSTEQAFAAVDLFYEALNPATGKDAFALVMQATAPEWLSCGQQSECTPRDQAAFMIAGFGQAIPDLKWTVKELITSGNRVVVRSEASGTPIGAFMGIPYGGKSFHIMSIDIHTIENGKIARSFHIEDWKSAVKQLSEK